MKYVQTVLGPISPEEMGVTLPHEHILWDLSKHNSINPAEFKEDDYRNQPLTMEVLGELKYHLWEYADNLLQLDDKVATSELNYFKNAGGGTICDNTCFEPRDPLKLQEISRKTGVNIVLGTGSYVSKYMEPDWKNMEPERLAEIFIKEIKYGIRDTGVRCGFIGEIGMDGGMPDTSKLSLAAAAIAQKETGAAILIHQTLEHQADKMFEIITKYGGRVDKTVMCHCDPLIPNHEYIDYMAKSGAYISFDFFGLEAVLNMDMWLPTDKERILAIREQIERGNLEHILISHDTCYKSMLRRWGGFGYAHILKHIIPMMLKMGYKKEWIKQITQQNPIDVFTLE